MRGSFLWSSFIGISVLGAQLPARYVIKGDVLSFLWREQRLAGEYRLFQWAPPFIASVERHRWEGLTLLTSVSYFRLLPRRGAVIRTGVRYYFRKPAYSPEGLWGGIHLAGGIWGVRSEPSSGTVTGGLTVGYQHIFHQAYGGVVEPYLLIEPYFRSAVPFRPIQVGVYVGFASRRWQRRNLH
ncbi:MAG: hypothetical protein N2253_05865 [Bacteroidia bacterium]|nr:hypothetical protein [Bacteroidia bacterium]MCX7764399.1 hypothetical protein [Bacteroidia bacterium]MDW8056686.1 hypothetical protein [Bacteroidia bacterium]